MTTKKKEKTKKERTKKKMSLLVSAVAEHLAALEVGDNLVNLTAEEKDNELNFLAYTFLCMTLELMGPIEFFRRVRAVFADEQMDFRTHKSLDANQMLALHVCNTVEAPIAKIISDLQELTLFTRAAKSPQLNMHNIWGRTRQWIPYDFRYAQEQTTYGG